VAVEKLNRWKDAKIESPQDALLPIFSNLQAFSVSRYPAIFREIHFFNTHGMMESNYHAAHDEEFAAHHNAIAARVLSQFPRDRAPVHVIFIDTPEANSFSASPERIYITRKMVRACRV
jgi:hypothetical protein